MDTFLKIASMLSQLYDNKSSGFFFEFLNLTVLGAELC